MGMLLKLDAVASLDWEWESYPFLQDFMVLPFFVLLLPSVHFLLDRFVFEKVARRLIFGKEHATLDLTSSTKRKKINKFKESAWKCIYYPSSELLALFLTYNEPWFTDTTYFWVGPRDQVWPDQKMKLKLKAYYMYATGFYVYAIFALIFWETRRSDFVISMGHHVTTVILLTCSYMFRFARVGSIVLALHEGSDVFIEVGKMSKYSGFERIADISFFMFVLSWFILRLICYPMWIIRSTSYEILLILDKVQHGMDVTIYYYLFNTLLLCLLVFHIYWWRLMFLMLVKQIQEGGHVSDDVRSDSEDENDHED